MPGRERPELLITRRSLATESSDEFVIGFFRLLETYLLFCCHIHYMDPLDFAVEFEGRLVEIVERHWRSERQADVKAVIGGKRERRAYWYGAFSNDLAVHLHGHLQRAA